MDIKKIKTIADLKKAKYKSKAVKDELRDNLIHKIEKGEEVFPGIYGYEDTVIPNLERAILSKHNINLLGLRGQAKTRIARLLLNLLDEYVPIVKGSEVNDDPFAPLSVFAREQIEEKGDKTEIEWLHRSERYVEKLATPDVSIADLIGDVDPIKAANLKLSYSDARVIHFGLIPRANRGIFVINELPDLQARIQVALFNILQEGDIQIRGFQFRFPLDVQFIFTANPEDYTNRGSIITPLKDRIQSQIMTHYPKSIELAKEITSQEARLSEKQQEKVKVPVIIKDLLEQISIEARQSEYVDEKSGVSARLSISAYELINSAAERRMLKNKEKETTLRLSDLMLIVPAMVGKIEMVYEGEQEGAVNVSYALIRSAIRAQAAQYFPELKDLKKGEGANLQAYQKVINWFGANRMDMLNDFSEKQYRKSLEEVDGLSDLIEKKFPRLPKDGKYLMMEYLLHAMAEYSHLSKKQLEKSFQFGDLLSSFFQAES
ncbi:MAG: magnesium chelatase [Flavobacteriales bacterium]|nr:magnesium chelatase [Flavobacteriales bacterium]|tara:strand:- start:910 stop:2379 length:1470 start_codon:yes stop_codon:yes gene_type:complete